MSTIDQLNTDFIPYFEARDISVSFGDTEVVKALSMQLAHGEIGCLLGFSGCGKTTALRAIAGLENPHQGQVLLNNKMLTDINNNKMQIQVVPAKRDMGMVFQDYALFNHLNVRDNIGFGLHRYPKAKKNARIEEMLALVELSAHGKKRISELSGGQQQRVALARALAPNPDLLLLDEPFSNLDMMLRESLASKVRDILKKTHTTAIIVTHDQHEAFAIADKIGVMHQGKLEQWATPDVLYHQPASLFIAEFVGEGALIDGIIDKGVIKTALGDIKRDPDPIHAQTNLQNHSSPLQNEQNILQNRQNLIQNKQNLIQNKQVMDQSPSHASNRQVSDKINSLKTTNIEMASMKIGERCAYNFADGTKIKVLIRPDDIVHDDSSEQRATIISRVFRGANFLYRLRLCSDEEVLSLIPSHHDHAIGTSIGFRPMLAHVVLFQGDTADVSSWHRL